MLNYPKIHKSKHMIILYCNVISDFTLGSLFKARDRFISQLNISCLFTNRSPDYLDINVLFYVLKLFFQSPDTCRFTLTSVIWRSLRCLLKTVTSQLPLTSQLLCPRSLVTSELGWLVTAIHVKSSRICSIERFKSIIICQ